MYVRKSAFWNEAKVKALLTASPEAVVDCLLVVYNNQTSDEQAREFTKYQNGEGFTARDAEFGTSLVKQHLAGRTWSPKQREFARKLALRYWSQFAVALEQERSEKGLAGPAPDPRSTVERLASAVAQTTPSADEDHEAAQRITEIGRQRTASANVDRYTWGPDDLQPVADGEDNVFADWLNEEPPLRSFQQVADALRHLSGEAFADAFLASPEYVLYSQVIEAERLAWLRLVYASHGGSDHLDERLPHLAPKPGLVPRLLAEYRAAKDAKLHAFARLSVDPSKGTYPSGQDYAAHWHEKYGAHPDRATAAWLASPGYEQWVREEALLYGKGVLANVKRSH
jgi:hypothetical protein